MCGICGFTSAPPGIDRWELLDRMTGSIVHRGPDEEGTFFDEGIALGTRRLSIIDVRGGSQPIFNEDHSICVVQNGEIYNFRELRERLESTGHRFTTRCDTEVLVHLYEEYGRSFVEHVNGMFAIAIWDKPRRRLLLVRDRLGVKPLYYAHSGDGLVFGSEIKCLLQHPDVATDLDHQAVYNYFTLGYIPAPRSIYKQIRKLPSAGRLVLEDGQAVIDRYWEPPREIDQSLQKADTCERLRALLDDAVRQRMISDVPLGAFLSGGLDSSIIVALMAQRSSHAVRTFFIDFDESAYSERQFARAVAARYETEHHEIVVRPNALDVLDRIVGHFDEPFGDSSAIPTWYVSQLTREHVTVALAGDGGDESFGGYNRYRTILGRPDLPTCRRLVAPLARAVHRVLPRRAPGRRYVYSLGLPNAEYYAVGTQEYEARCLLSPEFLEGVERPVTAELNGLASEHNRILDRLAPYARFDLQWYLPDDILTKVDRMSMAHSLEVRGPFLDYRVVELAARMPAEWKIRGGNTKLILKETFGRDLPESVLRPRKRGFSVPMAAWLRSDLRPLLEDALHASDLAEAGIVNEDEVRGLLHEHIHGVRDRAAQLWRILVFAHWNRLDASVRSGRTKPQPVALTG